MKKKNTKKSAVVACVGGRVGVRVCGRAGVCVGMWLWTLAGCVGTRPCVSVSVSVGVGVGVGVGVCVCGGGGGGRGCWCVGVC